MSDTQHFLNSLAGCTLGDIFAGLLTVVLFPYSVALWIQIARALVQ